MVSREEIIAEIDQMEDFAGNIAEDVINNPQLLPVVLDKIYSGTNKVKFDSASIVLVISRKSPEILYPYMDFFIELLDNKNKLNMWNTIEIIANLSAVDSQDRVNDIFDRFYDIIFDDSMVAAVHVIDNSWKIVKSKSELQERVIDKLLEIEKISWNKKRQNILLGHVIISFDKYFTEIHDKNRIISFVKRQLNNPRNATKVKAKRFLRKYAD
ncbi:hypothetical protein [Methanobacterium sp.]|uniref:hypothetical protein n=1 Tax=Methanobacterium sp. TaxID=2164 RepID=UPI003C75126E